MGDGLDPIVDGGHIQFAPVEIDTFGSSTSWASPAGSAAGRGRPTGAVTTANAGGSKIDLFLDRREQYDVRWDPATGQVEGTLTVTLRTGRPPAACPTT